MTTRHRITTSVLVAMGLAASGSPALAVPIEMTENGAHVTAAQTSAPVSQPTVVRVSPVRRATSARLIGPWS